MWDWVHPAVAVMSILGALLTSVWYIAWFISKQLSGLKDLFFVKIEAMQGVILSKLEYHERHDDSRFAEIRSDVNAIKLRNASRDGWANAVIQDIKNLQEGQLGAQEESKSFIRRKTQS